MDSDRPPDWTRSVTERMEAARSTVRVGVVDARGDADGRTFIAAQGFGAQIEHFEMRRFALIAHLLRARIVVVETPGFDPAGSGLLRSELQALRAGDFGPLAARMLKAAIDLTDDLGHGRLSFLGYSLGASLAGAMAAAATAEGWAVDELVLVEPVGLRSWTIPQLLSATRHERHWDAGYLSMNSGSVTGSETEGADVQGSRVDHWLDQLHLGAALRSGGLIRQLQSMSPAPSHLVVVSADRSALTGPSTTRSVADLRASGLPVSELKVPGHHGFWHALSLVGAMTQRLEKSLQAGAVAWV